MRTVLLNLLVGAFAAAVPGVGAAQDVPPTAASPPQTSETPPAAPQGDQWKAFSRSSARVYLIELNHIIHVGDVTGVRIARVPVTGAAGDDSHTVVESEVRCDAKTSRVVAETEVDPSGTADERIETGEDFETYSPGGLDGSIATLICENHEPASPSFPSVKAYIDDGRK